MDSVESWSGEDISRHVDPSCLLISDVRPLLFSPYIHSIPNQSSGRLGSLHFNGLFGGGDVDELSVYAMWYSLRPSYPKLFYLELNSSVTLA